MSELEAIVEQARSTPLSAADHDKLKAVLSTLARLTQELENKRTSISRLRHLLFGARSENSAAVLKQHGQGGSSAGAGKRNQKSNQKKTQGPRAQRGERLPGCGPGRDSP